MAGNTFGKRFRLTTFGESHGVAIGGVIDGCPAGIELDMRFIMNEMGRRKPGQSDWTTPRNETDEVEFLSGIFEGKTTGTPMAFMIRNKDQRVEDYNHLKNTYRPSHADFTYDKKYGFRDHRGGGRASARETAARVAGGAVAKLFLMKHNISIHAYVSQIGDIHVGINPTEVDFAQVENSPVRCPVDDKATQMIHLIEKTRAERDSLGGIVTCVMRNVPAGLGEPVFDKVEAELAKAMLSINAVKGFEIGGGFSSASAKGSEHNDVFVQKSGRIATATNFSGGVQGGMSNGEDIVFRVAFKPVATLMQDQVSVDNEGEPTIILGKGRHDVCVVPRAVPIVEAMGALVITDLYLQNLGVLL
jgi:chorismate synthase